MRKTSIVLEAPDNKIKVEDINSKEQLLSIMKELYPYTYQSNLIHTTTKVWLVRGEGHNFNRVIQEELESICENKDFTGILDNQTEVLIYFNDIGLINLNYL